MLIRVAVGRINKGCKGRFHLQLEPNPAKSEQSAERTSSGDTTADTGLQYPRELVEIIRMWSVSTLVLLCGVWPVNAGKKSFYSD